VFLTDATAHFGRRGDREFFAVRPRVRLVSRLPARPRRGLATEDGTRPSGTSRAHSCYTFRCARRLRVKAIQARGSTHPLEDEGAMISTEYGSPAPCRGLPRHDGGVHQFERQHGKQTGAKPARDPARVYELFKL